MENQGEWRRVLIAVILVLGLAGVTVVAFAASRHAGLPCHAPFALCPAR